MKTIWAVLIVLLAMSGETSAEEFDPKVLKDVLSRARNTPGVSWEGGKGAEYFMFEQHGQRFLIQYLQEQAVRVNAWSIQSEGAGMRKSGDVTIFLDDNLDSKMDYGEDPSGAKFMRGAPDNDPKQHEALQERYEKMWLALMSLTNH
jgi:hypothetical protein